MDKTVFLIGFMGCGKSTLGRALAQRTGARFVDLDDYIETGAGMSIRDIFASRGEAAFRELERQALVEVSSGEGMLVACGGGTPCYGDNMELMNSHGVTVHLLASRERLLSRLMRGRHKRPLIASLDDGALAAFIDERLADRMPWYSRAALTFDSSRLEDQCEISQTVSLFLDDLGKAFPDLDLLSESSETHLKP